MLDFFDLRIKSFSLAINEFALRLVKIKTGKKSFSLQSFNEQELKPGIIKDGIIQDETAFTQAIKQVCSEVKGEKLKTKYAIVSLPEGESFSQVIQMPKMTNAELKMAVVLEAENYIPMPMDKVYFDFKVVAPIKDGIDHLDVLIVAMSQKVVDSYISCIKSAGLIPVALEIESQAIARALIKNETSDFPIILIDFNDDKPNFIIFSGKSVRFTSSASFSPEEDLVKSIASSAPLKANDLADLHAQTKTSDKLIQQIEKYADFYKSHASHEHIPNDSSIKKIILCGGRSDLKQLAQVVSEKMGIKTEIGDPFINFPKNSNGPTRLTDPLRFTTALGLELRNFSNKNLE